MKLITAVVNKEDSKAVCNELLRNKFYVTRLATTGGFLMAGNMDADDRHRGRACGTTASPALPSAASSAPRSCPARLSIGLGLESAMPIEVTVGGATVFVTNVERF